MNASRLTTLAKLAYEEIQSLDLAGKLNRLTKLTQAAINGPNEETQRSVLTALNELRTELAQAPSNQLTPAMRSDLSELKFEGVPITDLLGTELLAQVNAAFDGGFTSVNALDRARQLLATMTSVREQLAHLTSALGTLGLKTDELPPGHTVVGITMPREVVQDLTKLEKELHFWRRFLMELSECVTGSPDPGRVYSLRSSHFGIDAETVAIVGRWVAHTITSIKTALDGLKIYRDLKKHAEGVPELPEGMAEAIEAKGKQKMAAAIESLEVELFQECKVDPARGNELKVALKFRFNGIANRMEQGFSFEVRTQLPAAGLVDPDQKAAAEAVKALSQVRFDPNPGPMLLQLPESVEVDIDASETSASEATTTTKKKKK